MGADRTRRNSWLWSDVDALVMGVVGGGLIDWRWKVRWWRGDRETQLGVRYRVGGVLRGSSVFHCSCTPPNQAPDAPEAEDRVPRQQQAEEGGHQRHVDEEVQPVGVPQRVGLVKVAGVVGGPRPGAGLGLWWVLCNALVHPDAQKIQQSEKDQMNANPFKHSSQTDPPDPPVAKDAGRLCHRKYGQARHPQQPPAGAPVDLGGLGGGEAPCRAAEELCDLGQGRWLVGLLVQPSWLVGWWLVGWLVEQRGFTPPARTSSGV